jgi:6-phosphogluconolactonase
MNFQFEIADNAQHAAEACGAQLLLRLRDALDARGKASLAVSGGSTPKLLFSWLAESQFPWDDVHLFWVDERAVSPEDSQSNYKLARDYWLEPARFPEENVHRIESELPVSEAAEQYESALRSYFGRNEGGVPEFDVIQQGMGADAHTASLFPGEPLILDGCGLAAAVYVDKLKAARVTLLPEVLKRARTTMMLVTGADKAPAVETVVRGEENLLAAPAQLTRRHKGDVIWYLDDAAAAGIR